MKKYSINDEVKFIFKQIVHNGTIVSIEGDKLYTVRFIYNPGDGRAQESAVYTITEKNIL